VKSFVADSLRSRLLPQARAKRKRGGGSSNVFKGGGVFLERGWRKVDGKKNASAGNRSPSSFIGDLSRQRPVRR